MQAWKNNMVFFLSFYKNSLWWCLRGKNNSPSLDIQLKLQLLVCFTSGVPFSPSHRYLTENVHWKGTKRGKHCWAVNVISDISAHPALRWENPSVLRERGKSLEVTAAPVPAAWARAEGGSGTEYNKLWELFPHPPRGKGSVSKGSLAGAAGAARLFGFGWWGIFSCLLCTPGAAGRSGWVTPAWNLHPVLLQRHSS